MLAVFLNNKLISCDTIIPVAMEVHDRVREPIQFYTVDYRTFDAIKNNIVLWDAIHKIGRLTLLGSRRRNRLAKLKHLPWALREISRLVIAARRGRAAFLHFRGLNERPLNLLQLANPKRTYFCESDSYGENELMRRIVEVERPREKEAHPPRAGKLVAFQPAWDWLTHPASKHLPKFVFGPTRPRRIWLDYIRARSDEYHRQLFEQEGLPDSRETVAFMLGYLGKLDYMRDESSNKRLLAQTLDVLSEECEGRPIILKPHVITDMKFVAAEVKRVRARGAKVLISFLHPCVLATRARFFIANYYSTTLADAHSMGVPTIEYTEYSDRAMTITDHGSMRPDFVDHFINADVSTLRAKVRQVLKGSRAPMPEGLTGDASGLIDDLVSVYRNGGG